MLSKEKSDVGNQETSRHRSQENPKGNEGRVLVEEPETFKEQVVEWAQNIGVKPKEIHVREMRRK